MTTNNKPIEDKNEITPFAFTTFRNERKVFGIKADDRRRHIYVIGKTGMGKSTLLENLVYSDISKGKGVCYVDPHGDTAEKILQWIPEDRVKDVIYFNPADLNHPIAFNVLEKVEPEFRDLVASGLVSVYKKLWADSWGPRLEYILRYCILALLDQPGSTLLGINRMLVDVAYRKNVISYVKDPVVKAFWEQEFTKWNDRVIAEVISPIQNKVGQFLSNSMIRNIVGQQESSFNMRQIMDEGKVLVLNLSKGRMGEDASSLLGAMMITKLQLAAMSRVDISEEQRRDFYLYVDEFQNFATESFATILSEARKYRLNLTIAHQYIAQLEQQGNTTVRDAVFGNVGTIIAFRVGAADAEFLEKEFAPQFTAEDLVNIPKFNFYLRLMVDGISTDPFSAQGLPPLASRDLGFGELVIENTRLTYTKTKAEVEAQINEWSKHDFNSSNLPSGKKMDEAIKEAEKKEETKKQKDKEKKKESKPILWKGKCDLCEGDLELTFVPSLDRPILCHEDLKNFRKGSLPGDKIEALMAKIVDRQLKDKLKTSQKENNKKTSRKESHQKTSSVTDVSQKGKGTIKIVKSFSDEIEEKEDESQNILSKPATQSSKNRKNKNRKNKISQGDDTQFDKDTITQKDQKKISGDVHISENKIVHQDKKERQSKEDQSFNHLQKNDNHTQPLTNVQTANQDSPQVQHLPPGKKVEL